MSTLPTDGPSAQAVELWRRRGWFLALGAGLMVLGVAAVVAAFATTMVTVTFLGLMTLAGGAAQVVHAFRFWGNEWGSFIPALLGGVLYAVAGALLLASPRAGALALTLMMAVVMAAAGLVWLASALFSGAPGRRMAAAHGLLTLLMGLLIWRGWPETGVWVIGGFVGVDLLLAGWALVQVGIAARSLAPRAA